MGYLEAFLSSTYVFLLTSGVLSSGAVASKGRKEGRKEEREGGREKEIKKQFIIWSLGERQYLNQ